MDNRPIGIFDSGLGGLTAVNSMKLILPDESFVYAGDTARVPYGGKDIDTLEMYAKEIVNFLIQKDVKAIIVACGTISSNMSYMKELWSSIDLPVIDVFQPSIEACTLMCDNKSKVGIIATQATIRSGMYTKCLYEAIPGIKLYYKACPLFVPIIEEGLADSGIAKVVTEAYLEDWREKGIDMIILGCTHYPLIKQMVHKVLPGVTMMDIAQTAVMVTKNLLKAKDMFNDGSGKIHQEFYVSGDTERFSKMCNKITKLDIPAKKVLW